MWCEKDLEDKRKLRYYKEVINSTLEDQKYLSVLSSSKKKINIAIVKQVVGQFLKHHGWKGSAIFMRI